MKPNTAEKKGAADDQLEQNGEEHEVQEREMQGVGTSTTNSRASDDVVDVVEVVSSSSEQAEQTSASLAEGSAFAPRRQSGTSSPGQSRPGAYSVFPHFVGAPNLVRSANTSTAGRSTGGTSDEEDVHHVVSAYAVEDDDDNNDEVDLETQQQEGAVQEAKIVNTVCGGKFS